VKKIAIGVAVAVLVVPVVLFGAASFAVQVYCLDRCITPWERVPTDDIPEDKLDLYDEAAERFDIPWTLLAAVGKVECDHGRDRRCSRPNEAGAEGPMQFLPATFARWSWAAGSPDPSPYNQRDAVFAAAAKLAADGIAADPDAALFSYNHSRAYVEQVEAVAESYGWSRALLPPPPDRPSGARA
jgi:membrane-bound lytic murein transglycosylase B